MNSATHLDNISPIQRLPPEILSPIFIYCLPPGYKPPNKLSAPLLLCQICSSWRTIAISTPRLWDTINIIVEETHPRLNTSIVSTWLQRSGSTPLQVVVADHTGKRGLWDVNEAIQVLAPHSSRWRLLYCELRRSDAQKLMDAPAQFGGLPKLTQLCLCDRDDPSDEEDPPPTLALSLCPVLSTASFLSCGGLGFDKDDPPYALKSLQGVFKTSSTDCLHLIQNSPSLEDLKGYCQDIALLRVPDSPIINHSITSLVLAFPPDPQVNLFLDSITLPSLKTLRLSLKTFLYDFNWSSLPRFIQRSSAPLESLEVDGCSSEQMIQCLLHAAKIRYISTWLDATEENLDILTCRHDPSDPIFKSDVAPYLMTISLKCTPDTTHSSLTNMVLSRWGGPSGWFPSKKRLYNLHVSLRGRPEDDLLTPQLTKCIDEGLTVNWTKPRW